MRWVWLVLAGCVACSKASEESGAKRSPISPPPDPVELPADLSIPVDIDGQTAPAITRDRLNELAPDFSHGDRRAWRLTRLIPEFDRPGATVEAVGTSGVAISLPRPASADQPQPVLLFTRRGEMVAAMVDPAQPFPGYHGQGGRLRRPGDPLPRIMPVVRVKVVTGTGAP